MVLPEQFRLARSLVRRALDAAPGLPTLHAIYPNLFSKAHEGGIQPMAEDNSDARKAAVVEVIANVKRLIHDARGLIEYGSQGSALSLAILAFEEAGKGHIIELDIEKPKEVRSFHEFRHVVALNVLSASLFQKYAVKMGVAGDKIAEHHRRNGVRPGKRVGFTPLPQELREELRGDLLKENPEFGDVNRTAFLLESRWIAKIGETIAHGGAEKLRQSGLYVDVDPDSHTITNTPLSIEPLEAQRWLWAASLVLNLLEFGDYKQSYSPLTDLIAGMGWSNLPRGEVLPRAAKLLSDLMQNEKGRPPDSSAD
jgi:hypothetical protein